MYNQYNNFLNVNVMKKFLFPFVLVLFVLSACAQQKQTSQQTSFIELNSDAKVYQTPATSAKMITGDIESIFEALSTNAQLLFPFVQEVISTKGDWLELPSGWVQKKDTHAVSEESLSQLKLDKIYVGQVVDKKYLTDKDKGRTNDYGVLFIKPDDKSDKLIVMISFFMGSNIMYTAKPDGNLIKCDKFIWVKQSKLDESLDGTSFTVWRDRGGLKLYQLNYGSRLNTVTMHEMLDEMYEVDVFDHMKMTASDFSKMLQDIDKLGNPTRLCISAGTIKNLTEEDIAL